MRRTTTQATLILLTAGLLLAQAAQADSKHFREGGGSGYTDVTFDDTFIVYNPADDTTHGNQDFDGVQCSASQVTLIAVKDMFSQLPPTSGGNAIVVTSATLHLWRYNTGTSSNTISIYPLTTNWLPGSAGTNENDVSGQHADKSADTHWASGNFSSSDYDGSVCNTGSWVNNYNEECQLTVTGVISEIYADGINYGMVLFANGAINGRASEHGTYRPTLEITYTYSGTTYTLTVNSGSGDGQYSQGAVVDITADAAPSGMQFDEWVGNTTGIADVNDPTTTITMPASDATITATYTNATYYTLTVNSGSGDGSYTAYTIVNIAADAAPSGKTFDKWTGNTAGIANVYAASTTLTMPASNATITATYTDISGPNISSVSGDVVQGNSITISGGGFGSKSQAAPRVWDNFESGADAQSIEGHSPVVGPAWDIYTSHGTPPKYSSVANRTNSTLCSRHDFVVASQYNCSLEYYETTDTAYLTFWWKYDLQGSQYNRNTKPWIEYGTEGYFPLLYNGFGNPDYGDGGLRDSIQDDPMPSGPTEWGGTQLPSVENQWIRFDVWAVQSSPNTSNGTLRTWVHTPYAGSPSIVLDLDNSNRMMRTGSSQWTQWHFGSYVARDVLPEGGGGPIDVYIYTDDVYFDVTLARVELGNASTWNGCTHREIQIPSSWSGSSITATVNRGSFPTGTAYLYVVDSQGNASPGYQVTITGGATYTLTVNSGSGDGSYTQGTVVNISADAAPSGKTFDKWTGDTSGIANVSAASTTLTMPAANQTVTATYKDATYTLTVNSGSGDGNYTAGTVVNISADTAPSGKTFDKWTGNTSGIANVNAASTTLTMPAAAQTVTATYKDIPYTTVKFREGGGAGFVNVTFDDTYIIFSPADDTTHGTETNGIVANTGKCALIAVKDLFTQIPATSGGCNIQISDAKLHLFRYTGSSSTTVSINRLTRNWVPGSAGTNENDVSGMHADKSADLHWAGGNFSTSDYDTGVVTTGAWGSGSNQELIYTVTNQVAGIYSSGANYGLVVRANAAIAGRASEYSTSSRRPQLEITYRYVQP